MADGKSRAFANDAPVSAGALKRFGELLVSRHGQHDQRGLLDSKTHRELLDRYADHAALVAATAQAFAAWKQAQADAEALVAHAAAAAREEEWLRRTVEELALLAPQAGEEEQLAEMRKKAQEAKQNLGALREALVLLTESAGVALQLRQVSKLMSRTSLVDVSAPLESAENAVEEMSVAIERALDAAEIDPAAIEAAEDRLHALRAAARKYNMAVALLPDLWAESATKLTTLTNLEAETKRARASLAATEAAYREAALRLIREEGVTSWINIPTMVIDLLGSPNADASALASLRHIGGGGDTGRELGFEV